MVSAAIASSAASSSVDALDDRVDLVGREGLLDRLVLGDGLDDAGDLVGREGILDRLVLGDGLGDRVDPIRGGRLFDGLLGRQLVDDSVDLGGSELLADLGEGGGERVVDPALGLLDRVRHRVAALGSRTPFLARCAGCARDARGAGLDDRAGRAAPRPA